jgi:hypothetical protein
VLMTQNAAVAITLRDTVSALAQAPTISTPRGRHELPLDRSVGQAPGADRGHPVVRPVRGDYQGDRGLLGGVPVAHHTRAAAERRRHSPRDLLVGVAHLGHVGGPAWVTLLASATSSRYRASTSHYTCRFERG